MGCTEVADVGFLYGLVDGTFGFVNWFIGIFYETTVYQKCHDSRLYELGFLIGATIFGLVGFVLGPYALIITLVIWVIDQMVSNMLVTLALLTLAYLYFNWHKVSGLADKLRGWYAR